MSTVLAFKSTKRSSPSIENGKVKPPRRVTNLTRRSREHLTPAEVERMIGDGRDERATSACSRPDRTVGAQSRLLAQPPDEHTNRGRNEA